ncbi:MAG: hypothetical protein R3C26_10690 [Calditrichia bacterium]
MDYRWKSIGRAEIPAIFRIIQDAGNVPDADMRRAFNLGFGLVVIPPRPDRPQPFPNRRRRLVFRQRLSEK